MKKIVSRSVSESIGTLHEHPILQRVFAARGVINPGELSYELKNLLSFKLLKGIDAAVICLKNALLHQQHVLVIGDFDVDGATSTALTILALKSFGLKNLSYLIPNRFDYGYGLSKEIVAVAIQKNPNVIITVDNGISSIEGVKAANELGIKVVITDHHLPQEVLPLASAIVNPNQSGDRFPSKNLAGVGVAFYLMLALRAHLREIGWFSEQNITEPNMAQFLDLVALGTVADSVNLDYNNRILVTGGINRIKEGKGRIGINAIYGIAKRSYAKATTSDFGFVIAPRLNAAGRLDDMSLGVECLLTEDPVKARSLAKKLDVLNDERRGIAEDMQHQASRILEDLQVVQNLPSGFCIFEETWHQGVLGILASRLKDKLQRPVIAFSAVRDNELKGSARSINSVHIKDVIESIASKNPGLVSKFGGHAMAAGLTILRENYDAFCQIFSEEVSKHITAEDLMGVIYTDGELPGECFNLETAELLTDSGPWGAGFSEPMFFGSFNLVGQSLVAQKHLRLNLRESATGQEMGAICFNVNRDVLPDPRYSRVKLVYRLGINEYNGDKKLQLLISEIVGYE